MDIILHIAGSESDLFILFINTHLTEKKPIWFMSQHNSFHRRQLREHCLPVPLSPVIADSNRTNTCPLVVLILDQNWTKDCSILLILYLQLWINSTLEILDFLPVRERNGLLDVYTHVHLLAECSASSDICQILTMSHMQPKDNG